jgi:hypothetical protein
MFKEVTVPDNKTKSDKSGGSDRKRINVNEDYELRDWSKKFGITQEELKKAVAKVGTSAEAVRKNLGKGTASTEIFLFRYLGVQCRTALSISQALSVDLRRKTI